MSKISHIISKSTFPSMRMAYALTISIIADLLDYVGAPVLAAPIIGDLFDFIVISYLYSVTKSKVVLVINLAEFVPFIGDFLPVYTVSTVLWILRETGHNDLISARQVLRYISMFVLNSKKPH